MLQLNNDEATEEAGGRARRPSSIQSQKVQCSRGTESLWGDMKGEITAASVTEMPWRRERPPREVRF